MIAAEPIVLKVVMVRSHHTKAAMRVTQRDRNRPGDIRMRRDFLIGLPAHVGCGIADAENGVQQQIERSAAGADDQVDS